MINTQVFNPNIKKNEMKKLIVYFHGYQAGFSSTKAKRLEAIENSKIFAFRANEDQKIAIKEVSDQITDMLCDYLNVPCQLIFVGSSLGGWLAATLAKKFGCDCILINPCYSPSKLLTFAPKEMSEKYGDMPLLQNAKYWFSDVDEVIPNAEFRKTLNPANVHIRTADHRFNGPEFDDVINMINSMNGRL